MLYVNDHNDFMLYDLMLGKPAQQIQRLTLNIIYNYLGLQSINI